MRDQAFWDRISQKYSRQAIDDIPAYEATLDHVRSYLAPDLTVLEIGCGTGGTARILSDQVARITGTDLSQGMIDIARERLAQEGQTNVSFAQAPAHSAHPDAPFDVILAMNVLHLVPDMEGVLQNVHNQLPIGGVFISKTPCLGHMSFAIRIMIRAMQLIGKAPKDVNILDTQRLGAALERNGFEIVDQRCFDAKKRTPCFVARKRP